MVLSHHGGCGCDNVRGLLQTCIAKNSARDCNADQWQLNNLNSVERIKTAILLPAEDENQEQQSAAEAEAAATWWEADDQSSIPVSWSASQDGSVICDLAAKLHQLADSIPKMGAFVEVFWVAAGTDLPELEENLPLYGALKRLVEWSHAQVSLFLPSAIENIQCCPLLETWSNLLCASVTCIEDYQHNEAPSLWRGRVRVVGTNGNKTLHLPGFSLEALPDPSQMKSWIKIKVKKDDPETGGIPQNQPESRILSQHLVLMAPLDRRDIPLFYFSGSACKLCLKTKSPLAKTSRKFMETLHQQPQLSYLMKLQYGSSWKETEEGSGGAGGGGEGLSMAKKNKAKKKAKEWEEQIIENIGHALASPFVTELEPPVDQYLFLLTADSQDAELVDPADHDSCTAYLLRPLSDLHGGAVHSLAMDEIGDGPRKPPSREEMEEQEKSAQAFLDSLLYYPPGRLVRLRDAVERLQVQVLQSWIDGKKGEGASTEISVEELSHILLTTRQNYLRRMEETGMLGTKERPRTPVTKPGSLGSELDVTLQSSLEYKVLALQSHKSQFGRCKSSDNLAGLSPPTRSQVVTLSAPEFLKFFKSDGTSIKETKSLVTHRKSGGGGTPLVKYNSAEVKSTTWPESGGFHHHDIYYNRGVAEETERKSIRLLSRLHGLESSSTFVATHQAHIPSTLTICTPREPDDAEPHRGANDLKGKGDPAEQSEVSGSITRSAGRKQPEPSTQAARKGTSGSVQLSPNTSAMEECPSTDGQALVNQQQQEQAEKESKASRSQRHKKKLEEVVKDTLYREGVRKGNPIFKACALRLFTITKCFAKDLTTSRGLREELQKIAQSHVKQIIDFENDRIQRVQDGK